MLTWDTVCLESVSACSQKRLGQSWRVPVSGWVPRWGRVSQSGPKRISIVYFRWEAEEVLSGALKITQRGMVKRRSYGIICQYVFAFLRLLLLPSVSHTPTKNRPFSRIKCESYIFNTKCYDHSSSMLIHHPSLWLRNIVFMRFLCMGEASIL